MQHAQIIPDSLLRAVGRLTLITALGICVLAGPAMKACGEPPQSREYSIKTAFLYNFAKFIEWPAKMFPDDPDVTPFTLCILGADPFGSALDSIKGKTVMDRNIVITRLSRIEDIKLCHILFISTSEKDNLPDIMNKIKGMSLLTVSDIEDFAKRGGIIHFITAENKVRFEINVKEAKQAGLKISSKLLKLAEVVESEQE